MPDLTAPIGADPATDLEQWLVERVAFYLEVRPEAVDPDATLVELGLDSVYAMTLTGDIEERFDIEVEPTIAWDHGSVRKLAGFLRDELARR
ncbi:MAG TPA: acyl carrier protein [Asanoa sp.]|jgi:acyl carrier protein|nr:acyl carrier protein [Asanoa sp.]